MPFSYLTAKRASALKLAQMIGTNQATLESTYSGSWATSLDGSEIPLAAFKDMILMVGKELATDIGNNPSNPARTFLYGRSADLANLAGTPAVDENGVEWVGTFDSAADSVTGRPLTYQPTEILTDTDNAFWDDTDLWIYSMVGNTVQTSRPHLYLQGCIWDNDAQAALYDSDGDCPLPQGLLQAMVNGVCGYAGQVGWMDNTQASQMAYQMYMQERQSLGGGTGLPLSTNQASG